MDLIDGDELSSLGAEKRVSVLESPLIARTLKVQVEGVRPTGRNHGSRQSGLADLTRPEEHHCGHLRQAVPHVVHEVSLNLEHINRNYNVKR